MRLRTTTSRQQSRRYRELFESHPVAMAVWDPSTGEVLAANDAALRQYGYEASEIRGLPVTALVGRPHGDADASWRGAL